jgi:Protein of unknown function (DUF3177)
MSKQNDAVPRWLWIAARIDFVAAVVLTVLVPLGLLSRALLTGRNAELRALLRYWRASALLMATVYLLAGARRGAFVAGVTARAAIAATLWTPVPGSDRWYERWRSVTLIYCLGGVLINLPLLAGEVQPELPAANRAYIGPTNEFAALLHPGVPHQTLGRIGVFGALSWLGAALITWLRRR